MNVEDEHDEEDENDEEGWGVSHLTKCLEGLLLPALELIPAEGPLHEICSESVHIIFAIKTAGDELIYKLLDHFTNVDRWIEDEDTSVFGLACRYSRSPAIIRAFLNSVKSTTGLSNGT